VWETGLEPGRAFAQSIGKRATSTRARTAADGSARPSPASLSYSPHGTSTCRERHGLKHVDVAAAVSGVREALGDIFCDVPATADGADGPPTLDALSEAGGRGTHRPDQVEKSLERRAPAGGD
jgi:hypothetical protein